MGDLIKRLADELEWAARRDHRDSTEDDRFDECLSHLCAKRRALLREAREAAARSEGGA